MATRKLKKASVPSAEDVTGVALPTDAVGRPLEAPPDRYAHALGKLFEDDTTTMRGNGFVESPSSVSSGTIRLHQIAGELRAFSTQHTP